MNLDLNINKNLYENYVKNKSMFFNSDLSGQSIKYESSKEIMDNKKILLMYSIPINENPLRSESEILKIKEIFEEVRYNHENYRILPNCSPSNFKNTLLSFNPDFIYYSGHSDENFISFENDNGKKVDFAGSEFIKLIESTNLSEIYLNSCNSKYILELIQKPNTKCIGYNQKVPDSQVRRLAIYFFLFLIRYEMDFFDAIEKSRNFIEIDDNINIPYIFKSS